MKTPTDIVMVILTFMNTPDIVSLEKCNTVVKGEKKGKVINHLSFDFFSSSLFVASLLVNYTNLSNISIIT
jgi:hypothetical protein